MIRVERKGLKSIIFVNDRPVIVTRDHQEALQLAAITEQHGRVVRWRAR